MSQHFASFASKNFNQQQTNAVRRDVKSQLSKIHFLIFTGGKSYKPSIHVKNTLSKKLTEKHKSATPTVEVCDVNSRIYH